MEFIKEPKFYVVWVGKTPGIYETWEECKLNISKFKGAKYKSFLSREEAEHFFKEGYEAYVKVRLPKEKEIKRELTEEEKNSKPIPNSISVDAACSSNPGPFEYRGVHTTSKRILFQSELIPGGSNNIGEFLAIVHALSLCKKHNRTDTIYSDSKTAIGWVKNKKVNTTIIETFENKKTFDLIRRAENWLKNNTYQNKVLKWQTRIWGEVAADYGRK